MAQKVDQRAELMARLRERRGFYARVVGRPVLVEIEHSRNVANVDHIFIQLEVPEFGRLRISINTLSRRNREAGFDPRVRVGSIKSTDNDLPRGGIFETVGLDYSALEQAHNVFYEHTDRRALELRIIEITNSSSLVEAWGELYGRNHLGLHQIHSRRASCAVAEEILGRDGAVKFYREKDGQCEMLLFKFCGQE